MHQFSFNRGMNIGEEERKKVDFPLNGPIHPEVRNHHHKMSKLRSNQTNFTARDLIQMLDDPERGYLTESYLSDLNGIFRDSNDRFPSKQKGKLMCMIKNNHLYFNKFTISIK